MKILFVAVLGCMNKLRILEKNIYCVNIGIMETHGVPKLSHRDFFSGALKVSSWIGQVSDFLNF